jgi:hypothetical protein
MTRIASIRRSRSAGESLPSSASISLCECALSSAKAFRPFSVSQMTLWRPSVSEGFLEISPLGQGKLSFQHMLAQYADLFRVEAIEAPHRFDARRESVFSHECPPLKRGKPLVDFISQLVDFVK